MLLIALSSPILAGVYQNDKLIKSYSTLEPASEALPKIFKDILREFECKELFYARGPGSFMALKVGFVYLRTLQIALSIPLFACDGFVFNQNTPIKAVGNQWFFKEKEGIVLRQDKAAVQSVFALPSVLDRRVFGEENRPLYILPSV